MTPQSLRIIAMQAREPENVSDVGEKSGGGQRGDTGDGNQKADLAIQEFVARKQPTHWVQYEAGRAGSLNVVATRYRRAPQKNYRKATGHRLRKMRLTDA
jgi:hypothetical protein